MKKILTVLLTLSVVFTYTVGTAFAATPSDSKTDAINALNEVANEVKGDISYYAGTDCIRAETDGLWTQYGGSADGVLSRTVIEERIQSIVNDYAERINVAEDNAWDAAWEEINTADKFRNVLFNIEAHNRWYTFSALTDRQFAIDMTAAEDALDPDLRNYTVSDQEAIKAAIDHLKTGNGSGTSLSKLKYKSFEEAAATEGMQSVYMLRAIPTFRAIVTEMENLLDRYNDNDEAAENLQDKTREVRRTLNSVSGDFIDAIRALTPNTVEERNKQNSVVSDVDNMVAFFEDKIDDVINGSGTDNDKVDLLDDVENVINATFASPSFNAEFYTDFSVLDTIEVMNAYAEEIADEKADETFGDGTPKYQKEDIEVTLNAALAAITNAAYVDIKDNSTTLDKTVVDTAFSRLVPSLYPLQQTKAEAIAEITSGSYDNIKWSDERQEKVIAIQETAKEDILNATTVEEINSIVDQAKADMDAILTIKQIETLTDIIDGRLAANNYTNLFEDYYDTVIGVKGGYAADTKEDALANARQVMINAVLAEEDANIPRSEIDQILEDTYSEALRVLVDVLTDAELAEIADDVDAQIAELPKVISMDDKTAVLDAQSAYEDYLVLAGARATDVDNRFDLEDALNDLIDLEVSAVRSQIRALPTKVTVADGDAIEAARVAYNELVATYGDYDGYYEPSNITRLNTAEGLLEEARLQYAAELVAALGSDPTEAEVIAARAAYDLLTTESKLKFNEELYADLLKAEASLNVNVIKSVESLKIVKNHSTAGRTNGKSWIRIEWSTVGDDSHVDGYEIYRSTKKNSGYGTKPIYTTKNPDNKWYKNTAGLKKNTRYYYKVRAFVEIDGQKYYSDWSNKAYRYAK